MLICYLLPVAIQCFSLGGYTSIKNKIVPKGANCLKCIKSIDRKARKSHQEYLHAHGQTWNAKAFLQELLVKKKNQV